MSESENERYSSEFVENPAYEGKASKKFRTPMLDHKDIVPLKAFDEYKGQYKDTWLLDRTENGIITAKWHTNGSNLKYGVGQHRGMWQLLREIGQDADNEVLIMGGAGDVYIKEFDLKMIDERPNMKWFAYEHMFIDGTNNLNALVNDVRIPTIGVINGSGYHTEWALLCDLTIMAEDAVISDPHFIMGGIPGDGIQTALRKTMGIKRANYAMYMDEQIDAEKALEYGLINEIVPKDKVYDRAVEIAQYMMTKPRITRRLTSEIMKQPWQEALAKELRPNFAMEMWSFMVNEALDHTTGAKQVMEAEAEFLRVRTEKQNAQKNKK